MKRVNNDKYSSTRAIAISIGAAFGIMATEEMGRCIMMAFAEGRVGLVWVGNLVLFGFVV
jgi:hypothetical protein